VVKLERAVFIDDRVTGVATTAEADDHPGLLGQEVGDLPFSFIPPLGADD
jgi:hypothetical protein